MHLLVLSAFRPELDYLTVTDVPESQCTFWCSVLSDRERVLAEDCLAGSQCTFWCSVLSDLVRSFGSRLSLVSMHLLVLSAFRPHVQGDAWHGCHSVSMHLLVLSAFRPVRRAFVGRVSRCLNAPFGAQCFPTAMTISGSTGNDSSQCTFWCSVLSDGAPRSRSKLGPVVSMHLLVLSAFRLRLQKAASQRRFPGRKRRRPGKHQIESSRTAPIKPHNPRKPPQIDPAPPTSPTHRYATGFQRTYTKRSEPRDSATVNTATKASVDYPSRRRDGPFSANRRFANRRFPVPVALPPAATSRSAVFRQPPHSGSAAGRSGAATVDKGRTEAGKNGQGQNRSRQKRTEWNRSQQTG